MHQDQGVKVYMLQSAGWTIYMVSIPWAVVYIVIGFMLDETQLARYGRWQKSCTACQHTASQPLYPELNIGITCSAYAVVRSIPEILHHLMFVQPGLCCKPQISILMRG